MYPWVRFIYISLESVIFIKRSFLLMWYMGQFLGSIDQDMVQENLTRQSIRFLLEGKLTIGVFQYSHHYLFLRHVLYSLDSLTKWPMARSINILTFETWCKFIITLSLLSFLCSSFQIKSPHSICVSLWKS